jgi:cobalt-zinc-cadmium efflux system outer membrane protein
MDTRSRRLAIMAAAPLFAWCCGVAAQPATSVTTSIDLPEAIRLALAQPRLQAAAHDAAAGDALVGQAASLPNPTLSYLREGQDSGAGTTTLQVSQPIELGGKRQARVLLAREQAALAHGDLAALRRAVRAEVIDAYYTVLVMGRKRTLAGELTALARRGVDVADKRVAAGKVAPLDATRARLAAADAAGELVRAEADLAVALTQLGALIGKPGSAIAPAGQDPDALPPLPPVAEGGDSSAVGRARSRLAAQQAQTAVERAARIPDLTLTLGTQRDDEVGRRQAVVGLSLPLPLFDRNAGRLAAALRRTDQAREELAAARTAAAADLSAARTRYEAARRDAALLHDDVLPGARSAWALTLQGFEAGKFTLLDVLDAQRTWFQAQSRHAGATLAAWRAYADIARLGGAPQQNTDPRP